MGNPHVVVLACTLFLGGACSKQESTQGLPPASNWEAPVAGAASKPNSASAANPHGGMANPHASMGNPHAGMDMNNPHAGMDMNNPHAGMDMNNPHAGMDMNNPHAGGSGVDVTALGLQAPDPNRTIDPNQSLSGTIKPTSETKAKIPNGSVIYISVKRADPSTGQPTGAPLAVKRLMATGWPLWFHITEEDAMIMGTKLDGDVVVTAWSDQDQDAISKQPGDVVGQVSSKVPGKDLTLLLDEIVK